MITGQEQEGEGEGEDLFDLVQSSGKIQVLDQLLGIFGEQRRRTLIFSQMTRMLDIISDFLEMRGLKYCRIDGSCQVNERNEQIDQFTHNDDIPVFLLSTRAGGLGLNLVSADTVILFDSDWVIFVDFLFFKSHHIPSFAIYIESPNGLAGNGENSSNWTDQKCSCSSALYPRYH